VDLGDGFYYDGSFGAPARPGDCDAFSWGVQGPVRLCGPLLCASLLLGVR